MDLSDEALVLKVQSGEIETFGVLVDRYEAKMQRYATKFLSDLEDRKDLVQIVFIKAYTNIQSFNPNRKFSPWLYRIAHNEFINALKKKGKEPLPFFDADTIFPHPIAKENPLKDLGDKEIEQALSIALDKLDAKYREPLVLYYFEGMDYDAIAEILLIPKSTVGVRLNRGKIILKEIYKQLNHE